MSMAAANAVRLVGPSCKGFCSQAASQQHLQASSAACPLLPPRAKLALLRSDLSGKAFLSGRALVPAGASGAVFRRSRHAAPRAQLIVEGGGRGESENGAVSKASVTLELIAALEKQLQAQALERPSANGKPSDTSLGVERSELAAEIQGVVQEASLASADQGVAEPANLVNGKASVVVDSAALAVQASTVEAVLTSENGAAKIDEPVVVTPVATPILEAQEGFQAARKPQVSVTPGGRWNKFKTYSTIRRTFEIWSFVATFVVRFLLIKQKWTYRGGMTEAKQKSRRQALALWLKEGLLRLGPTFIKIGQQFSTRVDVLSQEYIDELSQLQDQVPAFDSATSVAIVEAELGAPVTQLFERFDSIPIAAASLGQVHRARIGGHEVVVKVQRPGLKDLFDIDLKNLRVLAQNLQKIDPKSDGAKRDWVAIYDECANLLYQEIDYSNEGRNAERFGKNFAEFDWVKVPTIYWEYTTPQVLTMEYCPGIKINNIAAIDEVGIDRKRLARLSVEAYLQQILKHGFFHADPHPGNIAVDAQGGGRLIFYDFGMMGSISSNIREGLVDAFYGVYQKSADKVLDAMVQMGVLVPTGDMIAVRRTAQFFLNSFEERLAAQRAEKEAAEKEARRLGFKKQLSTEEKTAKRSQRLAAIGEDLLALSSDQPFRFPATFTFVVRAFSILDGIGKGLDPRFDISEIARPYAQELLNLKEAGAQILVRDLQRRWERQATAFANLFRGPDRVAKLEKVVTALEQGDLKLRVRTLESERAFKRVAQVQSNIGKAILAGTLLNVGTVLYSTARALNPAATAAFTLSAFLALQVVIGNLKVRKLDKTEASITGAAL